MIESSEHLKKCRFKDGKGTSNEFNQNYLKKKVHSKKTSRAKFELRNSHDESEEEDLN